MSRFTRGAALAAATAAGLIAFALPASAHVTVSPTTTPASGYATLTFSVPNEENNANTTKLDVQLPPEAPIASVAVQPVPGWTFEVRKTTLTKPLQTDDGSVSQVVSEIIWTPTSPDAAIRPGEFQRFTISAGPMPDRPGSLSFKALQTYSDGTVVRWIDVPQAGQPEPDHPAPTLTVTNAAATDSSTGAGSTTAGTAGTTAASGAAASENSNDSTARGLGIAGLVLGVLGLAAGAFALVTSRRRGGTAS
jgi:uncharacterized protein